MSDDTKRFGRNGRAETVGDRFLSEGEQRARIRIAALVLEAQLIARIKAGERKTREIAEQVQSVQDVLGRVGREPGVGDRLTVEEHHVRLQAAIAAVEGSDEVEGLSA